MHRSLLPILRSPCCHRPVSLWPEDTPDVVIWGELVCEGCTRHFPVREGVPELVLDTTDMNQHSSFSYQWKMRMAGKAEPENVLWGVDTLSLPFRLRGGHAFYLDCGCGAGLTLRQLALLNPEVQAVGMDISDVVYDARARDQDIPNLHYVRADALNPPFLPECFGYILALGVLHHTGDTRRAVLATLGLLQRKGHISLWLYPQLDDLTAAGAAAEHDKWRRYYFFRDRLFMQCSHKIPLRFLRVLCAVLSALFSPFAHLLNQPIKGMRLRYRSNFFILFDNLAARWQDRPRKQDVLAWFREAGHFKVMHSFARGGVYTGLKA